MPVSSYQVERLIDRLRQLREWLPWPAYRRWRGDDQVRMSLAARGHAQGPAPTVKAAERGPPLAAVRDIRRYPPVVEQERERRAGSFMEPPYLDPPAPGHLPKLGPRSAARRKTRDVAEGD